MNKLSLAGSMVRTVRLLFDARTPKPAKIVALVGLLYTIWPIDVLPDVVPGLGWIDDATVLALAFAAFLSLVPRMLKQEAAHGAKVVPVKVEPRVRS